MLYLAQLFHLKIKLLIISLIFNQLFDMETFCLWGMLLK